MLLALALLAAQPADDAGDDRRLITGTIVDNGEIVSEPRLLVVGGKDAMIEVGSDPRTLYRISIDNEVVENGNVRTGFRIETRKEGRWTLIAEPQVTISNDGTGSVSVARDEMHFNFEVKPAR